MKIIGKQIKIEAAGHEEALQIISELNEHLAGVNHCIERLNACEVKAELVDVMNEGILP